MTVTYDFGFQPDINQSANKNSKKKGRSAKVSAPADTPPSVEQLPSEQASRARVLGPTTSATIREFEVPEEYKLGPTITPNSKPYQRETLWRNFLQHTRDLKPK